MIGCTTQNCTYLFQRKKVGLTRYLCKKNSCVHIQILIWRPQDMICFNQLLLKHQKKTWKTWEVCPFQLVVIFRRNFLLSMVLFSLVSLPKRWKKRRKHLESNLVTPNGSLSYGYFLSLLSIPGTLWWPLFSLEFGPCFGGQTTTKIEDQQVPGILIKASHILSQLRILRSLSIHLEWISIPLYDFKHWHPHNIIITNSPLLIGFWNIFFKISFPGYPSFTIWLSNLQST